LLSTVAFAPEDDNEQARNAVERGERLYTLGPSGGFREIELFEDGIRATSDHGAGDQLDDLPPCQPDTLNRLGEVSERSKERDWKSRTC
jgi:hypothetical protein